MLTLVQKFHREACLLLLLLSGLACGYLAAVVLGSALRPPIALVAPLPSSSQSAASRINESDLNNILQRNIFDASARDGRTITFLQVAGQDGGKSAPRKDLTLLGTLVAGANSTVLISVDKEIVLFHVDEQIPDGGRIEEIQRNQVTIRYPDRSLTTLILRQESPLQTAGRSSGVSDGEIVSVGANRWKIAQSLADAAREDISQQLRLAQMEPRLVGGKTDGFLVRRLNARSLLVKMGLQVGDVVLQVNNMKLDSPEKTLQILQQLREARRLTVDVERGGKPMTFIYEID